MKTSHHPFFCHKKECRKSILVTPEYLDNKVDIELLKKILETFQKNDRGSFNKLLKEFTGNTTQSNFKETAGEMFFYRVAGWPEGNRYYRDGSDEYQKIFFDGFVLDFEVAIVEFLKNKS